jgi:CRP-like cAMP-binding protein
VLRSVGGEPIKNALLLALPEEGFALLRPVLERVLVPQGEILYEIGDQLTKIYFVESGLVSLLATSADGVAIEVGLIGCEGMLGISYLFSEETALLKNLALQQCILLSVDTQIFKSILDKCANEHQIFRQYFRFLMVQSTQIAACNSAHRLQQRLARWLLMASDRLESKVVPMTQEVLASILGVRRGGLTIVAGELRGAGLIRYHHGEITLLDRKKLAAVACQCYQTNWARFTDLPGKTQN